MAVATAQPIAALFAPPEGAFAAFLVVIAIGQLVIGGIGWYNHRKFLAITVTAGSGALAYAELALRIGDFAVARRLHDFEAGVNPAPYRTAPYRTGIDRFSLRHANSAEQFPRTRGV